MTQIQKYFWKQLETAETASAAKHNTTVPSSQRYLNVTNGTMKSTQRIWGKMKILKQNRHKKVQLSDVSDIDELKPNLFYVYDSSKLDAE